jgi:hypothetical protein
MTFTEDTRTHTTITPEPHPPGKFQFAFGHRRGEPWWLTDGYGHGKKVGPIRWTYYRAVRRWRVARFNRSIA